MENNNHVIAEIKKNWEIPAVVEINKSEILGSFNRATDADTTTTLT